MAVSEDPGVREVVGFFNIQRLCDDIGGVYVLLVLYYGFGLILRGIHRSNAYGLSRAGCTPYKHRASYQDKAEALRKDRGAVKTNYARCSGHEDDRSPDTVSGNTTDMKSTASRHRIFSGLSPTPLTYKRPINVTAPPSIVRFEWRRR
ncbi:MAG: hypothetical protein LQ351_004489 [Letrouitia transgressa]|nr:MAG: hypothetical protein LQ351_004489 [Letrouitia transgressa]